VPTSHTPQDIGAKTVTPGQVDSNPGNEVRAPRPGFASNPTATDVQGHPPIHDTRLAGIVGGNRTPEAVLAEAGSVPAPAKSPAAPTSAPAAPAKAPTGTPTAPSAPAKTPASAPSSAQTKEPEDLTNRGDKKK
jgi:hypothetical protein